MCVCVCVWSSHGMFAPNQIFSKATETLTRGKKNCTLWIFFPFTIQKYNSTIVNVLSTYISLGNRENCNKCISAFVYTFWSKGLHRLLYFCFYCIDIAKMLAQDLHVFSFKYTSILKVGNRNVRYIGTPFENVHINEPADVILTPRTRKNVWLQPDGVESCISQHWPVQSSLYGPPEEPWRGDQCHVHIVEVFQALALFKVFELKTTVWYFARNLTFTP